MLATTFDAGTGTISYFKRSGVGHMVIGEPVKPRPVLHSNGAPRHAIVIESFDPARGPNGTAFCRPAEGAVGKRRYMTTESLFARYEASSFEPRVPEAKASPADAQLQATREGTAATIALHAVIRELVDELRTRRPGAMVQRPLLPENGAGRPVSP